MLAVGHRGPMLLEDANDIALMAEKLKRTVPAFEWVDELREQAEYDKMMGM